MIFQDVSYRICKSFLTPVVSFYDYISDKFKAYHFMTLLKYPAHFFLRSECSLCIFDDTVMLFYHLCNCDTFMF